LALKFRFDSVAELSLGFLNSVTLSSLRHSIICFGLILMSNDDEFEGRDSNAHGKDLLNSTLPGKFDLASFKVAATATIIKELIKTVLSHYPDTQAIYLFGSWGTEDEWPNSDVDIGVLLPPKQAKLVDSRAWHALAMHLGDIANKSVDLLNLRQVSTVFQKEVAMADRRIFCADECAADEFEMLTLSFYQKLNEERAGVLAEGLRSGRFYQP